MPNLRPEGAIGIFDSGLGGLTVARAVERAFPHEAIEYLGDTARVPYGTKSPETVRRYAREIVGWLAGRGVKAVVAACNTVSAVALPGIAEDFHPLPVLGVVEEGARCAAAGGARRIGVIGTETTIESRAYPRALEALAPGVEVWQRACPLLVPLIEEGWLEHPVTDAVLAEYLEPMRRRQVEALILGCTHYPLLRPALSRFFGSEMQLVDSAEAMAAALGHAFDEGRLAPAREDQSGRSRYTVTDRCNHFQALVEGFLGRQVRVEQIASDALAAG